MPHEVKDDHDRDDGARYRQHDAAEGADVGAAVHICRFDDFLGHGVGKEVPHDQQVRGGDGAGQHHHPEGVEQIQVLDHDIGGDHAARKEHREGDHEGPWAEHQRHEHRGRRHGVYLYPGRDRGRGGVTRI